MLKLFRVTEELRSYRSYSVWAESGLDALSKFQQNPAHYRAQGAHANSPPQITGQLSWDEVGKK